jgi:hypothetical protein
MKTNGTLITLKKTWLLALVPLLLATPILAQSGADFNFINSSLISGTDRLAGSIYCFTNVRAGVDCRVSIVSITAGTSVATVDDNSANTGYIEAFQPRIQVNGRTRGYAEFKFRFVKAGTNTDTVMNEIPATSIDIDGNGSGPDSLLEFDEYLLPASYIIDYDMLAGQLTFNMGANSILGRHRAAIEYDGIDTSGRSVMFTVVYPHASTFSVRIGVDNNKNGSTTRQRSVYFKRFVYPNSFLPVKELRSFAGVAENDAVRLNWSMNRGHNILSADVERSWDGARFTRVHTAPMANELNNSFVQKGATGNAYYRLKLTDANGKISYSEVLFIKNASGSQGFKVYPSVISDYTTVNFSAALAGSATLSIMDNNGRIIKKQIIAVQQGFNSAVVNGLDQAPAGMYVAVLSGAGYRYTQKILKTE